MVQVSSSYQYYYFFNCIPFIKKNFPRILLFKYQIQRIISILIIFSDMSQLKQRPRQGFIDSIQEEAQSLFNTTCSIHSFDDRIDYDQSRDLSSADNFSGDWPRLNDQKYQNSLVFQHKSQIDQSEHQYCHQVQANIDDVNNHIINSQREYEMSDGLLNPQIQFLNSGDDKKLDDIPDRGQSNRQKNSSHQEKKNTQTYQTQIKQPTQKKLVKTRKNALQFYSAQIKIFIDSSTKLEQILSQNEKSLLEKLYSKPIIENFDSIFRQQGNLRYVLAQFFQSNRLWVQILGSKTRYHDTKIFYRFFGNTLRMRFIHQRFRGLSN